MSHGGKRIGAGKKPSKHGAKGTIAIRLTPDVMAYLREKFPDQISDHIDLTVRKQAGFKAWLKARPQ